MTDDHLPRVVIYSVLCWIVQFCESCQKTPAVHLVHRIAGDITFRRIFIQIDAMRNGCLRAVRTRRGSHPAIDDIACDITRQMLVGGGTVPLKV
jgi:hypothetical protein